MPALANMWQSDIYLYHIFFFTEVRTLYEISHTHVLGVWFRTKQVENALSFFLYYIHNSSIL